MSDVSANDGWTEQDPPFPEPVRPALGFEVEDATSLAHGMKTAMEIVRRFYGLPLGSLPTRWQPVAVEAEAVSWAVSGLDLPQPHLHEAEFRIKFRVG